MVQEPPCYDKVNHRDCPDRAECRRLGRSQCKKWAIYEEAHRKELENRQKRATLENTMYELTIGKFKHRK